MLESSKKSPPYISLYFPSLTALDELPTDILRIYKSGLNYFENVETILDSVMGYNIIKLNYERMTENLDALEFINGLGSDYPLLALSAMELASHEVFYPEKIRNTAPKITIRLYNYGKIPFLLRDIKSNNVNKFIRVEGTVVRVSRILPLGKEIQFECQLCKRIFVHRFEEGIYNLPKTCKKFCNSKSFLPIKETIRSVDWQRIRLQELRQDNDEPGRMPRTVDIELEGDLVDTCIPGDIISVCGILKSRKLPKKFGKRTNEKQLFFLYIHGNSVSNAKDDGSDSQMQLVQFAPKDLEYIKKIITETNDIFSLIINSFCPVIYGNEMVKAGICLSLFGGVAKYDDFERGLQSVRGDIHILLCGDPALGKSQMLRAASSLAMRGVYVSGNTSSKQGMTVTVVREKTTGEYTLEAGALVLSDQGVCCVDEFDKMKKEDHKALLEAMEQQSVSIAKAGIVCHLPTRCSVIAAANPVGGHYDLSKSLSENIKMDPALLSRFDLLFVLLDRPENDTDALISSHVFGQHATNNSSPTQIDTQENNIYNPRKYNQVLDEEITTEYLKHRFRNTEINKIIPHPLLRKYISYAKKYCNPVLGKLAKAEISSFYIELRKKYSGPHHAPVTSRQLESIIRLCQARARIEMRDFVTQQDALEVISIMRASMFDVFDELGTIDMRNQPGEGESKGNAAQREANRFIDSLLAQARSRGSDLFSVQEMREVADRIHINYGNSFPRFIERLNLTSRILLKPMGNYQVVGLN